MMQKLRVVERRAATIAGNRFEQINDVARVRAVNVSDDGHSGRARKFDEIDDRGNILVLNLGARAGVRNEERAVEKGEGKALAAFAPTRMFFQKPAEQFRFKLEATKVNGCFRARLPAFAFQ